MNLSIPSEVGDQVYLVKLQSVYHKTWSIISYEMIWWIWLKISRDTLEGCQSKMGLSKLEKVATLVREKQIQILHTKKKPENKWWSGKGLRLSSWKSQVRFLVFLLSYPSLSLPPPFYFFFLLQGWLLS